MPSLLLMSPTEVLVTITLSAAPDLSNCQNQKTPGHTHTSFRSFKHFNQSAFFADLICTPFDNVHQHTDPNEALAVCYKLFMDVVNRNAPIPHKRVKHSKLPPWLNKNIIQAMSDRDRLKKERMFTEYTIAHSIVKKILSKMQTNCILGDLWKTTKICQFGALWTLSLKKPTLDRRKFRIISQLMHLMTTFCPLQKP